MAKKKSKRSVKAPAKSKTASKTADSKNEDSVAKDETLEPKTAKTAFERAAAKVKKFPQTPGVYLMKNVSDVVIYVGKATNLRSRAGSYFLKAAAEEQRTANWIGEIADVDYMDCESEVDALLVESRLIKDI